jgi:hypothetical protein
MNYCRMMTMDAAAAAAASPPMSVIEIAVALQTKTVTAKW